MTFITGFHEFFTKIFLSFHQTIFTFVVQKADIDFA